MRVATPVSFNWDQESSEKSTILEVQVGDRLGLAYRISNTLAGRGLDIVFAKVATEKRLALDIFYVVDEAGEELPDQSCHD
jgi:UTP:GlnB (protein PII) uridylyltransferase